MEVAECSFTLGENATSYEISVPDDDSLTSLGPPSGSASEATLMDATHPFVYLVTQTRKKPKVTPLIAMRIPKMRRNGER